MFESADVNFQTQEVRTIDGAVALLWEAEPEKFARRHPDSDIVAAYGSSWPPLCIDFWAYIDADDRRARLRPEGWVPNEIEVALVGDGERDGIEIAKRFATVLRVAAPSAS